MNLLNGRRTTMIIFAVRTCGIQVTGQVTERREVAGESWF